MLLRVLRCSPADVAGGPHHQHIDLVGGLGPVRLAGSNSAAAAGVHCHAALPAADYRQLLLPVQLHDWAAAAAA